VDARNDESGLQDGGDGPPSASALSLPEAVAELAAAIRAQNEISQQVLAALVEQNAALMEAMTEQDDEPERPRFDMAGNAIKVTG
jgi:hypothetical protein